MDGQMRSCEPRRVVGHWPPIRVPPTPTSPKPDLCLRKMFVCFHLNRWKLRHRVPSQDAVRDSGPRILLGTVSLLQAPTCRENPNLASSEWWKGDSGETSSQTLKVSMPDETTEDGAKGAAIRGVRMAEGQQWAMRVCSWRRREFHDRAIQSVGGLRWKPKIQLQIR